MERTFTAEQAAQARSAAEANGRRVDRPAAHAADKIEYTRRRACDNVQRGPLEARDPHFEFIHKRGR